MDVVFPRFSRRERTTSIILLPRWVLSPRRTAVHAVIAVHEERTTKWPGWNRTNFSKSGGEMPSPPAPLPQVGQGEVHSSPANFALLLPIVTINRGGVAPATVVTPRSARQRAVVPPPIRSPASRREASRAVRREGPVTRGRHGGRGRAFGGEPAQLLEIMHPRLSRRAD